MNALNGLVTFLGGLAILFLIFLAIRALVLWYFRIGEMVELLKSIDKKLGIQLDSNLGSKR